MGWDGETIFSENVVGRWDGMPFFTTTLPIIILFFDKFQVQVSHSYFGLSLFVFSFSLLSRMLGLQVRVNG